MTAKDYDTAADWADHDMTLPRKSRTARRGKAAAAAGSELIKRSQGGRPSIDPAAAPGDRSPVRQVRLPRALDADLVAFAERSHRKPSEIMRAALREYLIAHRAAS